jgi:ECF transporter S component (folate family)
MNKISVHTRRIVVSALFLAVALVLRTYFRLYIPVMGESGMRLSVHGIFSIMPSILFGPVYGAMVSGLTDMIGHFANPAGLWLPQLTLSAAAGGFIRGWLWIFFKKCNPDILRIVLASIGAVLILSGGYHMWALRTDGITQEFYRHTPERREAWANGVSDDRGAYWSIQTQRFESTDASGETYWLVREDISAVWGRNNRTLTGVRVITERHDDEGVLRRTVDEGQSYLDPQSISGLRLISRLALNRSFLTVGQTAPLSDFITFTTVTMTGIGGFLLLLILLDIIVRKVLKKYEPLPRTMALILAMMIPAILVSTVNTLVFRQTIYTSWQLLPLFVVWLPRVLQSIATTTLNVFFVSLLIGLCERQPHIKQLLRK